jgi:hypothetical protein
LREEIYDEQQPRNFEDARLACTGSPIAQNLLLKRDLYQFLQIVGVDK